MGLVFRNKIIMEGGSLISMLKVGLCVSNTYFVIHKYTRVARSPDGVEVMSMMDLVLMKKDTLRFAQDVRAVRGMG